RRKGFWLVTVLQDRQVNLTQLAKKLRFAELVSAMLAKLQVGQGCATPLALFCDLGYVRLVLDSALLQGGYEKLHFHPVTNSATLGLSPDGFLKFVRSTGHQP
ncbi:PRXD1 protein, partial [Neodrepanis coruscans]|nr:PRXD1 protein [Neodrepanis coruscans]